MQIADVIVSVLSGLAVCIPLAVKLVEYVRKSVQERNWKGLLGLVIGLMEQAESMFDNGLSRREWVIGMALAGANSVGYELDEKTLGELIDTLCELSKNINSDS